MASSVCTCPFLSAKSIAVSPIYIHTNKHTHTQTCLFLSANCCLSHICIYRYIYSRLSLLYTHTHTHTHTNTHTQTHTHILGRVCVCAHTRAHTHPSVSNKRTHSIMRTRLYRWEYGLAGRPPVFLASPTPRSAPALLRGAVE